MRRLEKVSLILVVALALLLAAVALSACDLPAGQPTDAAGTPTSTEAAPEDSTEGQATVVPGELTPQPPSAITLTVWTIEAFSPTQAITGGQILAQASSDYEAANPSVRLQFIVKKDSGKGGILDFLQTTSAVVPNLLPDVALVNVDELDKVVDQGLLQPLDDLIPAELVDDLYPFASEACTYEGQLYCLQFQADLNHLVYDTGKVAEVPVSWPDVLSLAGTYTFPAAGQGGLVNDDFLIQYLAVRSWPADGESDEPFLDEDSLVAVLQYYDDGVTREVFPPEILTYDSTEDTWRDFLAGLAAATHVSAHGYLVDGDRAHGSAPAAIPTINGPASAIGSGWALAVVSTDPFRQPEAVEFVTQLLRPEVNAAWNEASGYLPTHQSALALWDHDAELTSFLHEQLLTARPRPLLPNYTKVSAAMQVAVESVLSGEATPEEAAAQAIEDGR